METITTFVLGAISALGILCLGYAFVQALKINKTIKTLQSEIENINREIGETHRHIGQRFDETHEHFHHRFDDVLRDLENTIKEIYQRIDQSNNEIHKRTDELNSYVDSRFDKQADKAGNVISVVSEASLRNGERLDKLEEIFKLQMDQFAKVTLNHSERLAELETQRKIDEDKVEQINS